MGESGWCVQPGCWGKWRDCVWVKDHKPTYTIKMQSSATRADRMHTHTDRQTDIQDRQDAYTGTHWLEGGVNCKLVYPTTTTAAVAMATMR